MKNWLDKNIFKTFRFDLWVIFSIC